MDRIILHQIRWDHIRSVRIGFQFPSFKFKAAIRSSFKFPTSSFKFQISRFKVSISNFPSFKFRLFCFKFQVSSQNNRVSKFPSVQVASVTCQVSDFYLLLSNVEFRVSNRKLHASSCQASSVQVAWFPMFRFQVSSFKFQVSSFYCCLFMDSDFNLQV